MLPETTSRTKIFINPNFKKPTDTKPIAAHINPKFLLKMPLPPTTSIHVNPAFLSTSQPRLAEVPVPIAAPQPAMNKIIKKSRTKLIREPMQQPKTNEKPAEGPSLKANPVIQISLRKLVRASSKALHVPAVTTFSPKKHAINANTRNRYKLDRREALRSLTANKIVKRRSFVSRYALERGDETLTPKRVLATHKRSTTGVNKKIELLNINGVLYKSTRNKLLRKGTSTQSTSGSSPSATVSSGRTLFVRGNKFVLAKSGLSLTRVEQEANVSNLKRIDIGGMTYVANSKNVLVRKDYHRARSHLSSAKQKSIQVLTRRLVKSNMPCPIYQRVGKCAAFERGKCPKVHDHKHVAICGKFLKGECVKPTCLLSHDISLSKMPVCKFFLLGCCVRDDCPYLHKKLSEKTEVCTEFLKGFCRLADKCTKRHEFLCPDFESKGKCVKVKCLWCRKQRSGAKKLTRVPPAPTPNQVNGSDGTEEKSNGRYFVDDKQTSADENSHAGRSIDTGKLENEESSSSDEEVGSVEMQKRTRPKLGVLPAFIPL